MATSGVLARFDDDPLLLPFRNPCELRGLCRHSYFGPRTCGGGENQCHRSKRVLNQGFPFSPLSIQCPLLCLAPRTKMLNIRKKKPGSAYTMTKRNGSRTISPHGRTERETRIDAMETKAKLLLLTGTKTFCTRTPFFSSRMRVP